MYIVYNSELKEVKKMNIEENILELKEKFNKIKNMGYVESTRKMWTGVGKTFEDLIGKQEN